MKIAKLQFYDIANGPGIRISLWVQGCHFHCLGCQNPETWDFNNGITINIIDIITIIKEELKRPFYSGFSILGGEPLAPQNRADVASVIEVVKKMYPTIKIWVWTGYTIEKLKVINDNSLNKILNTIDVLIDGPYIEAQRDLTLPYRGSKNQRIHYLREEVK